MLCSTGQVLLREPSNAIRVRSDYLRVHFAVIFEILEMLLREISDFKDFMSAIELHGTSAVSTGCVCGVGFDLKILMNCPRLTRGKHANPCRRR